MIVKEIQFESQEKAPENKFVENKVKNSMVLLIYEQHH